MKMIITLGSLNEPEFSDVGCFFQFVCIIINHVEFIGAWWYKDHIDLLCKELKLKGTIIDSPNELYHSHYRYDILIEF